jgi:hypothetical protein
MKFRKIDGVFQVKGFQKTEFLLHCYADPSWFVKARWEKALHEICDSFAPTDTFW